MRENTTYADSDILVKGSSISIKHGTCFSVSIISSQLGEEVGAKILFRLEILSVGAAPPEAPPPETGPTSSSTGSAPQDPGTSGGGTGIEGISLLDSSPTPSGQASYAEGETMSMASWRHLRCLSPKLTLKSRALPNFCTVDFSIISSTKGSGSGWEGPAPESLGSHPEELEVPSEAGMGLSGVEGVK